MEKAVTALTSGFSQFEGRWSFFPAENNRKTLISERSLKLPRRNIYKRKNGDQKVQALILVKQLGSN